MWPSNSTGVICVTNTTDSHNMTMLNDMATPLVFVGNISEMITHGIGPTEAEKLAIKPRMKISKSGLDEAPR